MPILTAENAGKRITDEIQQGAIGTKGNQTNTRIIN